MIFRQCRSDIFALRKHNDGDMFCRAKRDIFDDIKCDIHSLRSYAICCPRATRCDTNPRLRSKHIACKTHIASQREISQIPQGIYIAKQKICYPFGQQILLYSSAFQFINKSVISFIIFRFSFSLKSLMFPATAFTLFLFFFLYLFPELLSLPTFYYRQLFVLTHFRFR